ncbi:MAG: hypothetical protein EZS28_011908 [Streblomastix strix]|uniref:Uncharacterized protein n=1 Tax=Streblomastix strix TaxID=222440 RepID=A0A5J4WCA0_9EUKA|nr:MAG: hypothetical protein EZS28_011908 [Streblomastix strix]
MRKNCKRILIAASKYTDNNNALLAHALKLLQQGLMNGNLQLNIAVAQSGIVSEISIILKQELEYIKQRTEVDERSQSRTRNINGSESRSRSRSGSGIEYIEEQEDGKMGPNILIDLICGVLNSLVNTSDNIQASEEGISSGLVKTLQEYIEFLQIKKESEKFKSIKRIDKQKLSSTYSSSSALKIQTSKSVNLKSFHIISLYHFTHGTRAQGKKLFEQGILDTFSKIVKLKLKEKINNEEDNLIEEYSIAGITNIIAGGYDPNDAILELMEEKQNELIIQSHPYFNFLLDNNILNQLFSIFNSTQSSEYSKQISAVAIARIMQGQKLALKYSPILPILQQLTKDKDISLAQHAIASLAALALQKEDYN